MPAEPEDGRVRAGWEGLSETIPWMIHGSSDNHDPWISNSHHPIVIIFIIHYTIINHPLIFIHHPFIIHLSFIYHPLIITVLIHESSMTDPSFNGSRFWDFCGRSAQQHWCPRPSRSAFIRRGKILIFARHPKVPRCCQDAANLPSGKLT